MENKLNPQFQTLTVVKPHSGTAVSRLLLEPLSGSATTHRTGVFLRFALCLLLMVGAGEVSGQAFITRWVTTDNTITIQTDFFTYAYNYNITWTNLTNAGVGDGFATGQTGYYTIAGLENGSTYQVAISGIFPRTFNYLINNKLRSIQQWGSIVWASMAYAFHGYTNLVYNATDVPNLTGVTDMSYMFAYCNNFNGNPKVATWIF